MNAPGLSLVAGASRTTLSLMLLAPVMWPFLSGRADRTGPVLFGLRREELAVAAGVAFLTWLFRSARRMGRQQLLSDAIYLLASVFLLSALLRLIIEDSGNGYFTATALTEGLYVLLIAHGTAMLMHWLVRDAVTGSTWQRAADMLTIGLAITLFAFWVFAALELHFVAAILIALVAGSYALLIVMLAFTAAVNMSPASRHRAEYIAVTGSPLHRNDSRHRVTR